MGLKNLNNPQENKIKYLSMPEKTCEQEKKYSQD